VYVWMPTALLILCAMFMVMCTLLFLEGKFHFILNLNLCNTEEVRNDMYIWFDNLQ